MLPALPHPRWQQLKQGLLQSIPGRSSSQHCTLQMRLLSWYLLWLRPLLPVPGKGHRLGNSLGPTTSLAPETRSRMSLSKCRPRSASLVACQCILWQSYLMCCIDNSIVLPARQWCVHLVYSVAHPQASSKTKILLQQISAPICFQNKSRFPLFQQTWLICTLAAACCRLVHAQPIHVLYSGIPVQAEVTTWLWP